jgi:tyrosinase
MNTKKGMATLEEIQAHATKFLKSQSTQKRLGFRQDTIEARRFTPFLPDLLETALNRTSQYMEVANSSPDNQGLERVIELAESQASEYGRDLIKYALMVFITHHRTKGSYLPIPSLEERSPEVFLTKRMLGLGPSSVGEDALAWFREDPLANAHHEHWHIVYPSVGIPDESNPERRKTKDRQGELFFYMHQQMLARYDTERLAIDLDLVKPLDNYSDKLEGYDPGLADFSPRPNGKQLVDIDIDIEEQDFRFRFAYRVKDLDLTRQRLAGAVSDQYFNSGSGRKIPVNASLLGATEEASIDSVSDSYYGNHHNLGHALIAYVHDPAGNSSPGVMWATETAIRDPIFWRWHRAIDDLSYRWQETQKPNDFSDAPSVTIRKEFDGSTFTSKDIILAFKDKIPGAGDANFNWYSYADETFGEGRWDEDFSSSAATTNQLETSMHTRQIDVRGQLVDVNYLDQREFVYFIRAENLAPKSKDVTVRIFLVAKSQAENRRMWIEMDKFRQKLPSGKTVVVRHANQSSVIKKPASKPPKPVDKPSGIPGGDSYCPCGWPYNLLLPRGRKGEQGMVFRLMVMLTDWDIDKASGDSSCGSMSYCGARDSYPDTRSMGYPFDRPFPPGRTISQTISTQKNMAARDITIRWI